MQDKYDHPVFDVYVDECERGRGYGLAFLAQLAAIHPVPITPVQELHDAETLWRSARSGHVTDSLSVNQMSAEKFRWQHLRPQVDQLEREVLQRFADGESWKLATGRGLGHRSTHDAVST